MFKLIFLVLLGIVAIIFRNSGKVSDSSVDYAELARFNRQKDEYRQNAQKARNRAQKLRELGDPESIAEAEKLEQEANDYDQKLLEIHAPTGDITSATSFTNTPFNNVPTTSLDNVSITSNNDIEMMKINKKIGDLRDQINDDSKKLSILESSDSPDLEQIETLKQKILTNKQELEKYQTNKNEQSLDAINKDMQDHRYSIQRNVRPDVSESTSDLADSMKINMERQKLDQEIQELTEQLDIYKASDDPEEREIIPELESYIETLRARRAELKF